MTLRDQSSTHSSAEVVYLEILPGLSRALTPGNQQTARLEVWFRRNDTLGSLLSRLAEEQHPAGIALWDAENKKVRADVQVVFNGRLIASTAAGSMVLNGGERIVLVPLYSGG